MRHIRLIYKLNKDNRTYYLWNVGSYQYELTDLYSEPVGYFNDMELDKVLTECRKEGFLLIEPL